MLAILKETSATCFCRVCQRSVDFNIASASQQARKFEAMTPAAKYGIWRTFS